MDLAREAEDVLPLFTFDLPALDFLADRLADFLAPRLLDDVFPRLLPLDRDEDFLAAPAFAADLRDLGLAPPFDLPDPPAL